MIPPSPVAALPVAARFDWYAATILDSPQRVIAVLSAQLRADIVPGKPRNGYARADELRIDRRLVATVYHGGTFDWPHAFASSDETDAFVEVVRANWPNDHRVTRMDCALDFDDGPDTFATLLDLCKGVANGDRVPGDDRKRASKINMRTEGDWIREELGRTLYLGSTKSAVMLRLYEKGIQLINAAAVAGIERTDVSRNLVRLEVQVRPDGPAKSQAALSEPRAAFGYAEWSQELLRRVDGSEVARVHIRERRLSEHERAMRWVTHQYRNHFLKAADDAGGWEAFGRALQQRVVFGVHPGMDDDDSTAREQYIPSAMHPFMDENTPF